MHPLLNCHFQNVDNKELLLMTFCYKPEGRTDEVKSERRKKVEIII